LLAAGRRQVKELWLTEGTDPSPILGEIDRLAKAAHVPVRLVSHKRLETVQMTEAPQGVVAFAEPLTPFTLEQLLVDDDDADDKTTLPFLVVAAGVTDPQNLGAIIRSAECAGATGIVIPKHRAAHVTPAVAKAAAGAVEYVRMALVSGVPSALQDLQKRGVTTVGLDEGGSNLFAMALGDRPIALVLGAEGKGLQSLVRQRCDLMAKIPIAGSIPSLNVSAAAAVACFEVARQRSAIG
jgi:23S rRNA (guanosine2251-2'-O)-methyltransferase